jgi:hypothetical protein
MHESSREEERENGVIAANMKNGRNGSDIYKRQHRVPERGARRGETFVSSVPAII